MKPFPVAAQILLLWIIGMVPVAAGTTYYVDRWNGNDGNSGTATGEAWQTLSKVSSRVFQPGDRILFHAGHTWIGKVDLNGNGSDGNPIVVDRYGDGSKPVIDGGGHVAAVVLENVSYWELNNLEIVNDGGPTLSGSADYRAGVLVKATSAGIWRHIHLKNLSVHDIYPETLPSDVGTSAIDIRAQGAAATYFDDVLVEGCHIWATARYGMVVRRYSETEAPEGYRYNKNIILRDNWTENTHGAGIQTTRGDGVLVENNLVQDPNDSCYWAYYCNNVVVQHNEFTGARGPTDANGAHIDIGCTNVVIQYNLSKDNEGGFAHILGACENSTYRYNVSINDGARVQGVGGATVHGYVIYVDDYMGRGDTPKQGSYKTKIYNNTIYVKSAITSRFKVVSRSDFTWVKNNLFILQGGGVGDISGTGTSFQNNLWYGTLPTGVPFSSGDVFANPLVSNLGGGSPYDYSLTTSSPAIAAGVNIDGNGGHDYFGNPVPVSPPCIGAHQTAIHLSWKVSDGNWDTSTWNWWDQDGGQYSPYFEDAHVTLDDSAWGGSPIEVTLTANRAPRSFTAANNATTYVLAGGGLTGPIKLTKQSGGTLILANNNYYTDWTDILGGTLQVGNGGTSGSLGTGSVVNNATLTFNRSDDFTFGNWVSGPGELNKWGAGTLTMQGDRSYTGRTVINEGTLAIDGPNRIGYAPSSFDADNIALNNNAVLRMTGSCTFSNTNRGWTIWSGGGVIETAASTSSSISGVITGGGRLTKTGAGNLTLNAANTYSGQTLVTGGLLYLGNTTATFGSTTGDTRIIGGGVRRNGSYSSWERFDLNPPDTSTDCLQVGGGGTWTFDGAVTLSSDAAVTADGNAVLKFTGSLYGPGGFTKNGYGNLVLAGNKAYAGQTVVNRGLVLLDDAAATLGSTAGNTRITGGAVRRNGTSTTAESFVLDPPDTSNDCLQAGGSGTWTISGSIAFASDAAVTADAGSTLFLTGGVSGSGALVKRGDGTLRLNGVGSHTGSTTVDRGTLRLDAPASLATVTVATAATLVGTGTIHGPVTVDGTIAPGASAGVLTASNDFDLTGIYRCEIDGSTCDKLAVGGALDISGATLDIAVLSGGVTQPVYVIATYGSLTGSFASVLGTPGGYVLNTSYQGNRIALVRSYATWAATHFSGVTNPAVIGFDADPDGDGLKNGIESVLGTSPDASSVGLTLVSSTAGNITFTHPESDTIPGDVSHAYQWSADLTEWKGHGESNTSGTTVTFTITPDTPAPRTTTVTATTVGTSATQLFLRLTATRSN